MKIKNLNKEARRMVRELKRSNERRERALGRRLSSGDFTDRQIVEAVISHNRWKERQDAKENTREKPL